MLLNRSGIGAVRAISKGQLAMLIAVAFVVSRLSYWLVAYFEGAAPISRLCQWDCGWYLGLASNGYDLEPHAMALGDAANWVFFPLYPLLTHLLAVLTGWSHELAGIVLSNGMIVLAAWVGVRYLEATRQRCNAVVFVGLCMFGPFSFYFATVYTEALFFLLFSVAMLNWQRERYFLAAIAAALLSLTRAVGVFWVVGMAVSLFQRFGWNTFRKVMDNPVYLVAAVVAPLGLFIYMFYLYFHVGDALAFKHGQVAWGRELHNPFLVVKQGLMAMDLGNLVNEDIPAADRCSYTYLAFFALLGMLLLLVPLFKRYWFEFVFGGFALFVPLATGLEALPRFLVGSGVFLFAVHDLIAANRFYYLWLLLFAAFNFWLLSNWYSGAGFLT